MVLAFSTDPGILLAIESERRRGKSIGIDLLPAKSDFVVGYIRRVCGNTFIDADNGGKQFSQMAWRVAKESRANEAAVATVVLETSMVTVNGLCSIIYTINESDESVISLSLSDTMVVFTIGGGVVVRTNRLDCTGGDS